MALRRTTSILAAAVVTALAGHPRVSACDSGSFCADGSSWLSGNSLALQIGGAISGGSTSWLFLRPDTYSLVAEFQSQGRQRTMAGRILLIDGRVMLLKGFQVEPGNELSALDHARVMHTFATNLLAAAFPHGPQQLIGRVPVDVTEARRPMSASTMNDSMLFDPPWTVKGSLERLNSEDIAYSLSFVFSSPGDRASCVSCETTLVGRWSNKVLAPRLDSAQSLEGWSIYFFRKMSRSESEGAGQKIVAQPSSLRFHTLGELQDYLRKN
jgi:hypothetical protein